MFQGLACSRCQSVAEERVNEGMGYLFLNPFLTPWRLG